MIIQDEKGCRHRIEENVVNTHFVQHKSLTIRGNAVRFEANLLEREMRRAILTRTAAYNVGMAFLSVGPFEVEFFCNSICHIPPIAEWAGIDTIIDEVSRIQV